jgi:hypothetical protein
LYAPPYESGTWISRPKTPTSKCDGCARKCAIAEGVMKGIIQANIDRFKLMLDEETDPAKRSMVRRLLIEQETELKKADETPIKKAI